MKTKITGDEPIQGVVFPEQDGVRYFQQGLTIRQYYAGLAMQGILSHRDAQKNTVEEALAMADLLIEELNKE